MGVNVAGGGHPRRPTEQLRALAPVMIGGSGGWAPIGYTDEAITLQRPDAVPAYLAGPVVMAVAAPTAEQVRDRIADAHDAADRGDKLLGVDEVRALAARIPVGSRITGYVLHPDLRIDGQVTGVDLRGVTITHLDGAAGPLGRLLGVPGAESATFLAWSIVRSMLTTATACDRQETHG